MVLRKERIMKLTGIAREDLEAKGLVLPNKLELEYRGTEIPDIYAERIGRKNRQKEC